MSKELQIGNRIFDYPEEGDRAGWGENATDWAEAVTNALENVQGPNDILTTSAILANNQAIPANIPGLTFNTGEVQSVEVNYLVIREYDSGSTVDTESGKILGNYNGSDFFISIEATGDAAITFSVTSGGQFQYVTDDKANHISSTIRFNARTIDQP